MSNMDDRDLEDLDDDEMGDLWVAYGLAHLDETTRRFYEALSSDVDTPFLDYLRGAEPRA